MSAAPAPARKQVRCHNLAKREQRQTRGRTQHFYRVVSWTKVPLELTCHTYSETFAN
jgi:hypothetical protein